VSDFDPISAKFFVDCKDFNVKTWRSRMDIRLLEDPKDEIKVKKEL